MLAVLSLLRGNPKDIVNKLRPQEKGEIFLLLPRHNLSYCLPPINCHIRERDQCGGLIDKTLGLDAGVRIPESR